MLVLSDRKGILYVGQTGLHPGLGLAGQDDLRAGHA